MKNLRKKIKIRLANNVKGYKICVSRPSFLSQKIFSRNFVAIHEIKSVLTLDRPIYVGFIILDLNKLLMFEFHYNYIKSGYGCGVKLLFTDTDSLVNQFETDYVYEDFYENKNVFDFSNYPKDSRLYDPDW